MACSAQSQVRTGQLPGQSLLLLPYTAVPFKWGAFLQTSVVGGGRVGAALSKLDPNLVCSLASLPPTVCCS